MDVFQRYLCLACGRTFNDKTGTIFENSKVSLSAWAGVAYLLAEMARYRRRAWAALEPGSEADKPLRDWLAHLQPPLR